MASAIGSGAGCNCAAAIACAFGGAQYRMENGAAIAAGDGVVCAGLLVRTAPEKGERRVFLLRQESVYWQLCEELTSVARRRTRGSAREGDRGSVRG
jgi:hypothetical protein